MHGVANYTDALLEFMTEENIPSYLNEKSPTFNAAINMQLLSSEERKATFCGGLVPAKFA